VKFKVSDVAVSLFLLLVGVVSASASTVTYSFQAQVPTNSGPMPGNFHLTVPDFITGMPMSQFTGSDFDTCSAPGAGDCFAEFYVGPGPISGQADDIGFGNNVCCFIYFFPENAFTTLGTFTADPFHSAGTATLTVAMSSVPEPSTFGLATASLALAVLSLRRRWFF